MVVTKIVTQMVVQITLLKKNDDKQYILAWSVDVCLKAYHWYLTTRRWPQRAKDTNCNHENIFRIAVTKINNFMQWDEQR